MTAPQQIQAIDPSAAPPLRFEREGDLAVLTLDRPAKRNAMSSDVLAALESALIEIEADASLRAVILAHTGPAFSAGHNIGDLVGAALEEADALFRRSAAIMEAMHDLPKPIIAQVEGLASAAGLQLALSCDLIVAAESARFQTPGVMIGLFCSTPMVPLSRAVTPKQAMEMLMTGRQVSAEEARQMGLVNRVVPADRLAAETRALAAEILQYSGATLGVGKRAFYRQLTLTEHDAYTIGREAMARNSVMEDAQEGMSAFLEKRPPRFKS